MISAKTILTLSIILSPWLMVLSTQSAKPRQSGPGAATVAAAGCAVTVVACHGAAGLVHYANGNMQFGPGGGIVDLNKGKPVNVARPDGATDGATVTMADTNLLDLSSPAVLACGCNSAFVVCMMKVVGIALASRTAAA